MTPKQIDGLVYIAIFVILGLVMFKIMDPYSNSKPNIIPVNENCEIIEYKDNTFLNCK